MSKNIILIGLMGAGKSSVGKELARLLNLSFVDTDMLIQHMTGTSISVIFAVEGEPGFRQREKKVIAEISRQKDLVIATGGGAVLDEENCLNLSQNGFIVYLHAKPKHLWCRTKFDKNRPLLQTLDPLAKLEELYTVRDPLYRALADEVIETKGKSLLALARLIAHHAKNKT